MPHGFSEGTVFGGKSILKHLLKQKTGLRTQNMRRNMAFALPMLISFKPIASPRLFSDAEYAKLTSDPCAPINIWRRHNGMWTDFLSDYNIARGNLYAQPPWGPDFEALARLKKQGKIGWFNLGYWPPFGAGRLAAEAWRETYLPGLRRNYEKAKALGLLEWACLYGADEVHPGSFDRVAGAAAEIAREFPDIPISTTSFDAKYGIDGSKLSAISWFTPKVAAYDPMQAEKARREGKHRDTGHRDASLDGGDDGEIQARRIPLLFRIALEREKAHHVRSVYRLAGSFPAAGF